MVRWIISLSEIRYYLRQVSLAAPKFPFEDDSKDVATALARISDRLTEIKSETNLTECAEEWLCAVRVATNVSEVYNLTEQWEVPKMLVESHIENILNLCPTAENVTK